VPFSKWELELISGLNSANLSSLCNMNSLIQDMYVLYTVPFHNVEFCINSSSSHLISVWKV
jgi:hypothetical protein